MSTSNQLPKIVLIFSKSALHVRFIKNVFEDKYSILDVYNSDSCLEMLKYIAVDYFILDHRAIEARQDIFLQQLQELKKTKTFQTILFTSVLKKSFDKQIKSQGIEVVIRNL